MTAPGFLTDAEVAGVLLHVWEAIEETLHDREGRGELAGRGDCREDVALGSLQLLGEKRVTPSGIDVTTLPVSSVSL